MPVRKTESTLPFNLTADDLGQNQPASDGKSVLISFLSSPVVTNRLQQYVIFVTDSGQAGNVHDYKWNFDNAGNGSTQTTINGYAEYTPEDTGSLAVQVELRNNSGGVISTITLQQEVVAPNPELEALITATDSSTPVAANPDISREIINDYRAYIDSSYARNIDPNSSANRLLFSLSYQGIMSIPKTIRIRNLNRLANALHAGDNSEFIEQAAKGVGLCNLRPHIMAMYITDNGGTVLPKLIMANNQKERKEQEVALTNNLAGISIIKLIDLFNVLRFPKSNIQHCKLLLDELKSEFYSSNSFEELCDDRSKCIEFITQFKEGPFQTS